MKNDELMWLRYDVASGNTLSARSGVYVLMADGFGIPKIKCVDPLGILYVGQSSNIFRRLNFGKRSEHYRTRYGLNASGGRGTISFDHSCLTFCLDFASDPIQLEFDSNFLTAGSMLLGSKPIIFSAYAEDSKQVESQLLREHFEKFGCLPPFNSTGMSFKSLFMHAKSSSQILAQLERDVPALMI